uniref:Uncharacterized protein n=1 Tax=Sphaerodactylus townsendi TaxID=933632 RepID=A0ACB8FHD6_9SAUR
MFCWGSQGYAGARLLGSWLLLVTWGQRRDWGEEDAGWGGYKAAEPGGERTAVRRLPFALAPRCGAVGFCALGKDGMFCWGLPGAVLGGLLGSWLLLAALEGSPFLFHRRSERIASMEASKPTPTPGGPACGWPVHGDYRLRRFQIGYARC